MTIWPNARSLICTLAPQGNVMFFYSRELKNNYIFLRYIMLYYDLTLKYEIDMSHVFEQHLFCVAGICSEYNKSLHQKDLPHFTMLGRFYNGAQHKSDPTQLYDD